MAHYNEEVIPSDLENRKFQCHILSAGSQKAERGVAGDQKNQKLIKTRQRGGPCNSEEEEEEEEECGAVSGGAAAPPLLSCRFHELATKTGFYQTAGRKPEEKREQK